MDDSSGRTDRLLRRAAELLTSHRRRRLQAEVTRALCDGRARRAERRFGWGRANVEAGLHELASGIRCVENFTVRGRPRTEDVRTQLAADIRDLAAPHTQTDPELKSDRRYTNPSAREVRDLLRRAKGYAVADLPSERTARDILNRMGYRLKRIPNGQPVRKTTQTGAVVDHVRAVREQSRIDPEALEISIDTRAKVSEGEYARGGKNPDGIGRDGGPGVGP